jgi:hypothetical protein
MGEYKDCGITAVWKAFIFAKVKPLTLKNTSIIQHIMLRVQSLGV